MSTLNEVLAFEAGQDDGRIDAEKRVRELEAEVASLKKTRDIARGIPDVVPDDMYRHLVLWAYKHVEISIGRACELLKIQRDDFHEVFNSTHPEGQQATNDLYAGALQAKIDAETEVAWLKEDAATVRQRERERCVAECVIQSSAHQRIVDAGIPVTREGEAAHKAAAQALQDFARTIRSLTDEEPT